MKLADYHRRMKAVREGYRLSKKLFGSGKKALDWLNTQQEIFFDEIPLQILMFDSKDRAEILLDWLRVRAGERGGTAF